LPLLINGKLDSRVLPVSKCSCEIPYLAPITDLELKICNIWREVLKLDKVGVTDDFFRIGGNSISAIKLIHKMNKELSDIEVNINNLYDKRNITSLLSNYFVNKNSKKHIKRMCFTDHNKEQLFFISPSELGCEVYADLAKELRQVYNTYALNNFNTDYNGTPTSLNLLATEYMNALYEYNITGNFNFCCTASDLPLALEIGYLLEQKGQKKINIILFDTKSGGAIELTEKVTLRSLNFSRVTFFKAVNNHYVNEKELHRYVRGIEIIDMECHQSNIMDYVITEEKYLNKLLSVEIIENDYFV